MNLKLNLFKYIVLKLSDWYIEQKNISLEEFNTYNDFNILKVIKLHFFVVTANCSTNPTLLDQNEFWAMPYGPVETEIYSRIKENKNFENFILSNSRLNIINEELPEIEDHFAESINKSIQFLKNIEPRLIVSNSGTLVDLTHEWSSWKRNFNLARRKNQFSAIIPRNEIVDDQRVFNIDLIGF